MGKRSRRRVSFVGRLSLSQRVLYQRFYCIFSDLKKKPANPATGILSDDNRK